MVKVVSKKSGCECRQAARPKQSYKIQIKKNNFKLYKADEIISTRIEILLVIIIDNDRITGG